MSTAVWGTGNVGRAAIRAVDAHPDLELAAVIVHNPDKVGRDAGDLADLDRTLRVAATDDIDGALGSIDDAFWKRMLVEYDQREIVELSMCLDSWLAYGRLNRVLGLDATCVLPSHREAQPTS
ncbi:MAG: hypothetical protein ACR2FE_06595 [Aeromicrobium sp.]